MNVLVELLKLAVLTKRYFQAPALIEELDNFDFGCQWDAGSCKWSRTRSKMAPRDAEKRKEWMQKSCCHNCEKELSSLGPIRYQDLPKYLRAWSPKHGFWRPGKGCILPRQIRPPECNTYTCSLLGEEVKISIDKIKRKYPKQPA